MRTRRSSCGAEALYLLSHLLSSLGCLQIAFQQETQTFTLSQCPGVKAVFSHLLGTSAQLPLDEDLTDHLEMLKEQLLGIHGYKLVLKGKSHTNPAILKGTKQRLNILETSVTHSSN